LVLVRERIVPTRCLAVAVRTAWRETEYPRPGFTVRLARIISLPSQQTPEIQWAVRAYERRDRMAYASGRTR
jgi:hypothetical protein